MSVNQFLKTRDFESPLCLGGSLDLDLDLDLDDNEPVMGCADLRSVSAGNAVRHPSNGIYHSDCHNGATCTRLKFSLTGGGVGVVGGGVIETCSTQQQECGADCKSVSLFTDREEELQGHEP